MAKYRAFLVFITLTDGTNTDVGNVVGTNGKDGTLFITHRSSYNGWSFNIVIKYIK